MDSALQLLWWSWRCWELGADWPPAGPQGGAHLARPPTPTLLQPGWQRLCLSTVALTQPSLKTGVSPGLVLLLRGTGPYLGTSVVVTKGGVLGMEWVGPGMLAATPQCSELPAENGLPPGSPVP